MGKGAPRAYVRKESRQSFCARWWRFIDDYLRGACQCRCVEDLAGYVSQSNAKVACWYAGMCRGLRARVAGEARVRCRRWSPGCGVNRKRRRGVSPEVQNCTLGFRGRSPQRDCVGAAVRGAIRDGSLRIVWGDSYTNVFRGKCLQACVASCLCGRRRRDAVSRLMAACRNNDYSFFAGTDREKANFENARKVLEAAWAHVWVYESASGEALRSGDVRGRWLLGRSAGVSWVAGMVERGGARCSCAFRE